MSEAHPDQSLGTRRMAGPKIASDAFLVDMWCGRCLRTTRESVLDMEMYVSICPLSTILVLDPLLPSWLPLRILASLPSAALFSCAPLST